MLTITAFALLASAPFAASRSHPIRQDTPLSKQATNATGSWTLVEDWSGPTFFDHWDFPTGPDPTEGTVDYVDQATAWRDGLISYDIFTGRVKMKVDTTPVITGGRKSVRLEGKMNFTGGLVLMDAVHMPWGCGTWPAWWSYSADGEWPNSGEIDILEGIHTQKYNKASVHTRKGCTMPKALDDFQTGLLDRHSPTKYDPFNCDALVYDAKGCGVEDLARESSYGKGFHDIQGGVYAMLWTNTTIQIFFFPRSSIPEDISCSKPEPTSWGKPIANFTSTTCDPMEFFSNHHSVFDTTFCGSWAGKPEVWNSTVDNGGQETSCDIATGYVSCIDYVRHEGHKFADAYWDINYVKYFNQTSI